jgi:RNA polymerase sigma-70 factor (ECF subfamily)
MQSLEHHLSPTTALPEEHTDLLRRIAAGDENALRELYAAWGQRLYAYALRLTGDPAAAEEVVQDSLVAAWQGAARFRGEGRVIAWLLGIVHHQALNRLRGRPPEPSLDEDERELPAPGPLPEAQAALHDRRRSLTDGIAGLTLEHRTVLELVFYQGLSLEEAAAVLHCPLGTVKSRLSYAKAGLRSILSRRGLNVEDLR